MSFANHLPIWQRVFYNGLCGYTNSNTGIDVTDHTMAISQRLAHIEQSLRNLQLQWVEVTKQLKDLNRLKHMALGAIAGMGMMSGCIAWWLAYVQY